VSRKFCACFEAAKPLHNQSLGGSRIVGVHVEGPFISKEKSGAQNPKEIRPPREVEWKKYLRFGKLVTEMTLAPESEGALPLIPCAKEERLNRQRRAHERDGENTCVPRSKLASITPHTPSTA
jgi:N-acetylglucosamine-6-phosphate deacetylase